MLDPCSTHRYVLDVYMPRDKHNRHEHRGFGFVTFETEAAVQRVAAHGLHQIRVRPNSGSIIVHDPLFPEFRAFQLLHSCCRSLVPLDLAAGSGSIQDAC